ncbi:MAG: class II fructose-bisphosphate aldolase [bacterium]|nr:class II fructose-bisphosphate aldolase [bacterium]
MPLVNSIDLIRRAFAEKYGVVQINTNGAHYGLVRAIVEVADEMKSPVLLGAYEANLKYRGYEYCGMAMRWFAERASVPVAIHLDHGQSVEACERAIEAGFTSVMIDGSMLPIEENIAQTARVVELAKPRGITVEAEVGELQRLNPDGSITETKNLSDPDEVRRISSETGIDMLAVGIGNAHGFYKGQPDIRFDLLEQLASIATVPLVLHGTTGLSTETIQRCISTGMAKVNLGTLIRTRYVEYTADVIQEGEHTGHPWRVCSEVKERIKKEIREIIDIVGSAGKAVP